MVDVYTWDLRRGERSLTCWQSSRSVTRAHLHRLLGVRRLRTRIRLLVTLAFLAFRQWTISASRFASDPPPCLPLLHARYGASQLLWRLSHPSAFHWRSCGDPRFTTPESSCRSVSNHPVSSHVRFLHARLTFAFWGPHRRAVSPQRPPDFSASPLASRLAKTQGRIEFLFVRTDRLAFRCSPPRLTTTQLRSAFNQSSIWLRVFSPPLQVRSRAH
jgi:hypothetical protein